MRRFLGAVNNAGIFEAALHAPGGRNVLEALVAALGLEAQARPIAPEQYGAWDVADVADLRWFAALAERGSMLVLAFELAAEPSPSRVADLSQRVRRADGEREHLLLVTDAQCRRIAVACHGLEGELRHLTIERQAVRATDLEALQEMIALPEEGGIALVLRFARALDRSRVTVRFFVDFRAQRARVAAAWQGVPAQAKGDREQLALLFLCRLMFLYFLQRRGHLAGDDAFLANLVRRWQQRRSRRRTFFRRVLEPLFFGALNTRPQQRTAAAKALGDLPYLNGGLFERSAVEHRHPRLDLGDDAALGVFEQLLERYRFTTRDSADEVADGEAALGIDPEMLGRVFEGMMAGERRGDTGTFFTPAAAADRLVSATLGAHIGTRLGLSEASAACVVSGDVSTLDCVGRERLAGLLRDLRVLDPACGSGAFLLAALSRVSGLRARLDGGDAVRARWDIVARSLHGVDLQSDAALLCALRLWLALTFAQPAGAVTPLPNLDRRIRQGDVLLDPLDVLSAEGPGSPEWSAAADPVVRRAAAALGSLAVCYVGAEPGERETVRRELANGERVLAKAWLEAVQRGLAHRVGGLRVRAAQRDLWGLPGDDARAASAALPRVEANVRQVRRLLSAIDESSALPFFSFAVHFANAALSGFDLVLTNPPWVRAHRWPATLRRMLRRRYAVCRDPGWRRGAQLARAPLAAGAQVDLALLFLERSLRALAEGGTLGILLPAKLLRSLYGGPARRMLLRDTRLSLVEDHSLDQHAIFAADSFTTAIVATRRGMSETAVGTTSPGVRIAMHRRGAPPLRFVLDAACLPVFPGDLDAPWLLAPPAVNGVLRRLQQAGPPLGCRLRVRRGIFTGSNNVLLVREVTPRLGGLAEIRAQGWHTSGRGGGRRAREYEALIESAVLRPLLRGGDISAWRCRPAHWVIWLHDDTGRAVAPPPRLAAYLERHRTKLEQRSGTRAGTPLGSVFRVSAEALGPKVVWHDLADTLKAVAVPGEVRTALGCGQPMVPLNTVYFIATHDERESLLLAALLNSLPVRTFARTIAERAKDARFRFFAWVLGVLPLPAAWRDGVHAQRMLGLSRAAHERGCVSADEQAELDGLVGGLYGLSAVDLEQLARFDAWLSGRTT